MVKENDQKGEFPRLVAVDRIGGGERVEEITATEEERGALAGRFGWISMERLTATVRLRRLKSGLFRVSGRFEAVLAQACVVTLKPVPTEIAEEFDLLFATGREALDEHATVTVALADEDPPEPIIGGQIDIGEAVVQQLAVSLDPYPRCSDAALPEELANAPEEDPGKGRDPNPFEVLARLKGRHPPED